MPSGEALRPARAEAAKLAESAFSASVQRNTPLFDAPVTATRTPEAYSVNYLRSTYAALEPEAAKDIETLSKALSGDFTVVSRTLDDSRWIVTTDDPVRGVSSHLYDRRAGTVTKLFDQRPALAGQPLQPMHAFSHAPAACARDHARQRVPARVPDVDLRQCPEAASLPTRSP